MKIRNKLIEVMTMLDNKIKRTKGEKRDEYIEIRQTLLEIYYRLKEELEKEE